MPRPSTATGLLVQRGLHAQVSLRRPVVARTGPAVDTGGVEETPWLTRADGTPGPAMSACLEAAIAAPSIHNTEPWLFRPHGSAVDVLLDRTRQLQVADADGREMHVSVGAALFNLRAAIQARGRQPLVRLLPDPDQPDLAATVSVGRAAPVPADIRALAEAIPAAIPPGARSRPRRWMRPWRGS